MTTAALPALPALPAQSAPPAQTVPVTAAARPNVFARDDTFFGVCQALGEDFGFNPLYLRIALAAPLIWYPVAMVSIYAALGVVVLVSRLLVRNPRRSAATAPAVEAQPAAAAAQPDPAGDNDAETLAEALGVAA
jgi:phage shock protein C